MDLLVDVWGRFFANDDLGDLVVADSVGNSLHFEKDVFFNWQIFELF